MTLSVIKAPLPVDKERKKICDKVFLNRVTLVLGNTGCGKSSRVPQMLLEELGGPILCTQPRRLAVVAVAKRVAEERGVTLGGDEVREPHKEYVLLPELAGLQQCLTTRPTLGPMGSRQYFPHMSMLCSPA